MESFINESTYAQISRSLTAELDNMLKFMRKNLKNKDHIVQYITVLAEWIEQDISEMVKNVKQNYYEDDKQTLSVRERMLLRKSIGIITTIVSKIVYRMAMHIAELLENFTETMTISTFLSEVSYEECSEERALTIYEGTMVQSEVYCQNQVN